MPVAREFARALARAFIYLFFPARESQRVRVSHSPGVRAQDEIFMRYANLYFFLNGLLSM